MEPSDPILRLELLTEPLALVQLPAGAPVPAWVAGSRHFTSITRTPDELSIVVDAAAIPETIAAQRDFRAFRVQGPLPLHLVGVIAALARPLAGAGIAIFPIATYGTDYLLVRAAEVSQARRVLIDAGHTVGDDESRSDGGD